MALEACKAWKGTDLIYIGECGGCTATPEFEMFLASEFKLLGEYCIPQWEGLHDYLRIYRRRNRRGKYTQKELNFLMKKIRRYEYKSNLYF